MRTASLLEIWAVGAGRILGLAGCAGDAGQRGTSRYTEDKPIATRVNAALLADELIRVAAYKGVIKESGHTDLPEPARQPVVVAVEVDAAKSAKNTLRIRQQ